MSGNITRRDLVGGATLLAAASVLAGCDAGEKGSDAIAAPSADKYPIDPEEWGKGTVRHSEEVVGDERTNDGWTRVTNEGGATLGVMDTSKLIQVDGLAFKDLNGNGKLDLFEDWRQSPADRAAAYAAELDVEANLGLMLHSDCMFIDRDLSKSDARSMTVKEALDGGARTFLNFSTQNEYRFQAGWNNVAQAYAESLPGSIPMSISTNERCYDVFPGNLGLAASFDPELAGEVARELSRKYRGIGVTTLLGPQMGVTSEPRWRRVMTGLGEDPALSRDMARALIDGYQSTYDGDRDEGWGSESVVCQMKHFPGDGCAEQGREAHYEYGDYNVYPGDNFQAQLIPFVDGALKLDGKTGSSAACMMSYSIAYDDQKRYGDLVGSAFSPWKVNLLRNDRDYDGLICTDFGVVEDMRAWGVMDKSEPERIKMVIEAGCDQIGGYAVKKNLDEAYQAYAAEVGTEAAEKRIRESGRRVMGTFFSTGLFDNPYVDSKAAQDIEVNSGSDALARKAQQRTIVMLKNSGVICKSDGGKPTVYIPMQYTEYAKDGDDETPASWDLPFDAEVAAQYVNVVTDSLASELTGPVMADGTVCPSREDIVAPSAEELAACDYALVVMHSPATGTGFDEDAQEYVPISLQYGEYVADGPHVRQESLAGDALPDGSRQNRAYFGKSAVASNLGELERLELTRALMGEKSVVVCMNADRPMVFSEVEPLADAILLGFVMDGQDLPASAFLDLATGVAEPSALLPLQMPVDMDTVEAQLEDVPRDMECYVDAAGNAYDFGFGLNWSGVISDERTARYCVDPLSDPEN